MKRKTVKVDENISEILEEMLKGNIVEVENGSVSKKICRRFVDLRKRDLLYNAYNQRKRVSYLWFDESVNKKALKKRKSSVFGDVWELIY